MPPLLDAVLLPLMGYFMLMNLTVERCYCSHTVQECAAQKRFLAQETLDFCLKYNPLFLARPVWMRIATCMSAYFFVFGYLLIAVAAARGQWHSLRLPLSLFLGMKIYALGFYHYMEFTSATPPPDVVPYFGVEGPYLVSIAIVLYRLATATAPQVIDRTGYSWKAK